MKIAVCIKQVPDSWAEKKMGSDQRLDRESVDAVLNDLDEYAIESAIALVEANSPTGEAGEGSGHTITVISMGPERASEALRKALSMGADDAILISDAALAGSDALATSKVLAAVISQGGFDLVFCGTESTDARMSVVPAMLAERLGFAQLTFAGKVEAVGSTMKISRQTEFGVEEMSADLPAVISVVEKINEPRYPSFKGIMASKKKPLVTQNLADIGVATTEVGSSAAWSSVKDSLPRPPRGAGVKIVDDGNAAAQLVAFLAERKLV
jgi:electron transfer flavoprotein beta subunit